MGLIHIANEIEQSRALPVDGAFGFASWIEGHRERTAATNSTSSRQRPTPQGTAWLEKSTLLARRASAARRPRAARARRCASSTRPMDRSRPRRTSMRLARSGAATAGCPAISIRSISPTVARGCSDSSARSRTACGRWHERLQPLARVRWRRRSGPTWSSSFRLFLPGVARLEHWPHDGRGSSC